jgi:hypothetical protein
LFGDIDEDQTVNKEDVREVPDHPSARPGLGHLFEPSSQAATGLI